jgi:RNA polymerase sigma factor (sigma-70 family)
MGENCEKRSYILTGVLGSRSSIRREMDEEEVREIVVKAQEGSEPALAELFRWFTGQKRFFSCAYCILRNWEEDAYDVMQESAIKIGRNINEYDPSKGSFASWCNTIVARAATDQLRRRLREEQRIEGLRTMPPADPHEVVEIKELSAILDEAEDKSDLSPRQRLVWHLHRIGYDIPFIATIVMEDTSNGAREAVSRDIWRAKRKIAVHIWVHYPDWAELYRKVTLLFNTELRFQTDLDNGNISEELRQEFENHQITPPRKLTIPNGKKGQMWLMADKDRPIYLICKEGDKLSVYKESLSERSKKHE